MIDKMMKMWANSPLPGRRSAFRKYCRHHRDKPVDVVTKHGFKMHLIPRDSVENQILVYGEYEPLLTQILSDIASQETAFIDVGCNVGYFSCLFNTFSGGRAQILSVDANPLMVERCKHNLMMNHADAQVVHYAITEQPGTVSLAWPDNAVSHGSLGNVQGKSLHHLEVPGLPLPKLLADLSWEKSSVLKIDIEGFEVPVLRTLDAQTRRLFSHVFFEYSAETYANCNYSLKDLRDLRWLQDCILRGISKKEVVEISLDQPFPADIEMIWATL